MKKLPLVLLLVACSPSRPAASPEQCRLIEVQFAQTRDALIDNGACDKFEHVTDCPAYMAVEQLYISAVEGAACP